MWCASGKSSHTLRGDARLAHNARMCAGGTISSLPLLMSKRGWTTIPMRASVFHVSWTKNVSGLPGPTRRASTGIKQPAIAGTDVNVFSSTTPRSAPGFFTASATATAPPSDLPNTTTLEPSSSLCCNT